MTKKELTNERIEDLIVAASNDPSIVNTWTDDVAVTVMSYMRKRGIIQKSDQWACISYINWAESLMQRFYLIAVNAYIARSLREYRIGGASEADCMAVEKFFAEKLKFNAEKHVLDGLDPKLSREKLVNDLGFDFAAANNEHSAETGVLTKEQVSLLTAARDSIRSAKNVAELVRSTISDSGRKDVLTRRIDALELSNARITNILGSDALNDALENIPPIDNVHYFNRFCSDNYAGLRKLTSAVYNVPEDMETTVWFHGAANSLAEIERFQGKIYKECSYGAYILGNGAPTLIAPDLVPEEANRKYGNIDVMNDILDRAERDQNIAQKITKKKAKDTRKKVILDDFKKNPNKKAAAIRARKANAKFDASGITSYNRAAASFRPGNDADVDSDEEQEIIDEIIGAGGNEVNETESTEEGINNGTQEGNKPIRILGTDASGSFGAVECTFDIPDEYSFEASASKESEKSKNGM